MKYLFLIQILFVSAFANLDNIDFFEADFKQIITDDKGKELAYEGHIKVASPKFILWSYTKPIQKEIYVRSGRVTIIEPEIEQVIIKDIDDSFDFFSMIKSAKKIKENVYITKFKNSTFTITVDKNKIKSISYKDELENSVTISFYKQVQNVAISQEVFIPIIPNNYDIIQD